LGEGEARAVVEEVAGGGCDILWDTRCHLSPRTKALLPTLIGMNFFRISTMAR
jgi:hypothetical protein